MPAQAVQREQNDIISIMKNHHPYLLPIFCFSIIFTLLMTGCTSKTTSWIEGIRYSGSLKKLPVKNEILKEIATLIQQETNASVTVRVPHEDEKRPVNLLLTDKYLKISFYLTHMFGPTETLLNNETQYYLQKITPILSKYPNILIQVIGHAYDEGKPAQMQHYADLRAISVAEYLFNNGLNQEILAKGCSDFIPRVQCDLTKPHTLCSGKNRRVDLFIYTDKADLITKCK